MPKIFPVFSPAIRRLPPKLLPEQMMLHLPMIQPPPEAEKQVPPATEWKFPPEPPTQMTGGSYVPCGAPVYAPPCLPAVSFSKKK
jgi:hypothetical protein